MDYTARTPEQLGCWCSLKTDQPFSLKNDQGRKPRENPSAVDNYNVSA